MSNNHKTGSCLCGEVAFRITGPLRPVVACHCTQCRKQTRHFGAFTNCAVSDLHFDKDTSLAWYRASDSARRGFCKTCGSVLFWQGNGRDTISISAGSLDGKTGLALSGHIFCADAGGIYQKDAS
jgi:hypothetical protein